MVAMTTRRKCRLWWPENLSFHAPLHFSYLFGWFVSSSEYSVDIVVAFACDEPSLSSSIAPRSDVREFLRVTNENMPASLQNKCKFSLLGSYVADYSVNGQLAVYGNGKKTRRNLDTNGQSLSQSPNACTNNSRSLRCGCHKLDGLSEQSGPTALGIMWIKLVCGLTETVGQRIRVIPKFDHLHWNGEIVFQLDIHIQTVAALWRLFRGRKWNPLRQRLDSYDYTVEQHVVGSLLFTPILLLLPTTSAFYIFFSSLHTAVSFICLVIGMTISIIHATPYSKIFIWLKTRKRFPSGICFEVASCKCIETGTVNDGEVVWPHYGHIYGAFSKSSVISSAYSLLSGTSTRYSNMMGLPSKLPWMVIPWKEYWSICHDSVYACGPSYL